MHNGRNPECCGIHVDKEPTNIHLYLRKKGYGHIEGYVLTLHGNNEMKKRLTAHESAS